MRPSHAVAVLLALIAIPAAAQIADPERVLADRFQFTAKDIAAARQSQPVVHVKTEGNELTVTGAIKLSGKKERLADWIKNIEHFRKSAELGTAHVVKLPATPDAFAGVPGDTPALRQTMAERTTAYVTRGNSEDTRLLIGKAAAVTSLAPALVGYLDHHPASKPDGVDEVFYWSAMPAGSDQIVSVHHLVLYRPRASEVWVTDTNIYATKYFDAAVLGIALYDAPDGAGFYAVAGSRMKSSQLGGVAGTVLRRQIQRSAADSVKTYLEWIRDSLALA